MLLQAERSLLLVIDIQTRLAPAIAGAEQVIAETGRLLLAADRLGVPVLVSEQYPKGLGGTDPRLVLPEHARVFAKTSFSCAGDPALRAAIAEQRRPQLVLAGMEAHVCVLQSALGLQAAGFELFVVADAVGSRRPESRELALARMRDRGVDIVSTEMVLFEWLGSAGHPAFREISRLIR